MTLSKDDKRILRDLAIETVTQAARIGKTPVIDVTLFPETLRAPGAAFVTLKKNDELRGCIGHLEAFQPLVKDVAENAYAAAMRDPRFSPLTADELSGLSIEVSVLSAPEPMTVKSQADLYAQLRPGVDGLILTEGKRRATFLPAVWENLPDPRDFLRHLKQKAGMSADHWSPQMRFERYRADKI